MFGIQPSGFKIKRMENISAETAQEFADTFGASFNIDPRTPAGQLKTILDEQIASIWEYMEATYFSQYPKFAEGILLDNAVSLTGLFRRPAIPSACDSGVGYGTAGSVIPAGTIISVEGSPDSKFRVDTDTIINIPQVDELQSLKFDINPDDKTFTIEFDGSTTTAINWNDNSATIQSAMELLSTVGVGNITVAGSIDATFGLNFTFIEDLGGKAQNPISATNNNLVQGATPVTITVTEVIPGLSPSTPPINLSATIVGPVRASRNTLTVIDTPVEGLDTFNNLTDAVLGAFEETDAELKQRQVDQITTAGTATVNAIIAEMATVPEVVQANVFVNNSSVTNAEGLPPHSVEIIVEGGDEDDIAQKCFDTVAAGIGYYGGITKTVIDSQGFSNTVRFSSPTEIDVYITIVLTVNSDFLTVDDSGINEVKSNLVLYGDELNIGDDVVVLGTDPSITTTVNETRGIIGYTVQLGRSSSPTGTINIIMTPRELAKIRTENLVVTVAP